MNTILGAFLSPLSPDVSLVVFGESGGGEVEVDSGDGLLLPETSATYLETRACRKISTYWKFWSVGDELETTLLILKIFKNPHNLKFL